MVANPTTDDKNDRYKCDGGIKKIVLMITVWHHEACQVMTDCDREGQIFLSHPITNNVFFFQTNSIPIQLGQVFKITQKSCK